MCKEGDPGALSHRRNPLRGSLPISFTLWGGGGCGAKRRGLEMGWESGLCDTCAYGPGKKRCPGPPPPSSSLWEPTLGGWEKPFLWAEPPTPEANRVPKNRGDK